MTDPTRQPSFSGIRSFLRAPTSLKGSTIPDVAVVGIPFDLGTSNRPGARHGPAALREASTFYADDWNPELWVNPMETLKIVDKGDLELKLGYLEESLLMMQEQLSAIKARQIVVLGGDHTCTLPILRALREKHDEPISIVHFDAHVDTWKENGRIDHGTPFHYAAQEGLIDPRSSIQIGIRSPIHPDTRRYTKDLGFHILSSELAHEVGPAAIAKGILRTTEGKKVYLTFDIDCIDPSQAPGTGTPEIGGLFTWQVLAIMKRLKEVDFIGMDLVEVAPAYDHAQITAQAGACFLWTYLCLLAKKKNK